MDTGETHLPDRVATRVPGSGQVPRTPSPADPRTETSDDGSSPGSRGTNGGNGQRKPSSRSKSSGRNGGQGKNGTSRQGAGPTTAAGEGEQRPGQPKSPKRRAAAPGAAAAVVVLTDEAVDQEGRSPELTAPGVAALVESDVEGPVEIPVIVPAEPDVEPGMVPEQAVPAGTERTEAVEVVTDTDGTGGLPSLTNPTQPARALRSPVVVRRRRPRVRRVTRVIRHVDTWSVFKVALVFNAFLYAVCLTAGVLLWQVAQNTGTVDNVERFFESNGWESFELKGGDIYHNAWIAGLFVAVGCTGLAVLAGTLFNLITDLVGGIRVSVLEEEVVAREARGVGWRRRQRVAPQRRSSDFLDPTDTAAEVDAVATVEAATATATGELDASANDLA